MSKVERGGRSNMNPVEEMAWITENINEEKQHFRFYEDFTVHPKSLHIYPGKPLVDREHRMIKPPSKEQQKKDLVFESDVNTIISNTKLPPKSKWAFPQTEQQEFGWYNEQMTYITSPKKNSRKFCKETKYADAYFDMTKMSPFSGKIK